MKLKLILRLKLVLVEEHSLEWEPEQRYTLKFQVKHCNCGKGSYYNPIGSVLTHASGIRTWSDPQALVEQLTPG